MYIYFVWTYVFICFEHIPRIAQTYGNSNIELCEELTECVAHWVHHCTFLPSVYVQFVFKNISSLWVLYMHSVYFVSVLTSFSSRVFPDHLVSFISPWSLSSCLFVSLNNSLSTVYVQEHGWLTSSVFAITYYSLFIVRTLNLCVCTETSTDMKLISAWSAMSCFWARADSLLPALNGSWRWN